MFERYTERARRVIFFARYESSQFGSSTIETEHLLLGILREDPNLPTRFLDNETPVRSISDEVAARLTVRPKISTSTDLPLSTECKAILRYAVEEAERLKHHYIGVEHLVLGILHEEKCVAAEVLRKHGMDLGSAREKLAKFEGEATEASPAFSFSADDAKRAMAKRLLFTVAYRFERTLDGAPENFESFRLPLQERTPHELICHMIQIVNHTRKVTGEGITRTPADFIADLKAFRESLEELRLELEKKGADQKLTPERLTQGALAELMVCIGQLTLLRSLAGSPVNPKDYWAGDPPG